MVCEGSRAMALLPSSVWRNSSGGVVERAMGTFAVVLFAPGCQSTPDVVERSEPAYVEAFIAQASVEALDVAVLHGPAGLDVDQSDLPVFGPAEYAPRGKLRPVGGSNSFRPPTLFDQPFEHARHAIRAETGIGLQRQHSLVYASTTLRTRTMRPVASPSTMKSIADSWLVRTSRAAHTGSSTAPRPAA